MCLDDCTVLLKSCQFTHYSLVDSVLLSALLDIHCRQRTSVEMLGSERGECDPFQGWQGKCDPHRGATPPSLILVRKHPSSYMTTGIAIYLENLNIWWSSRYFFLSYVFQLSNLKSLSTATDLEISEQI